MADIKFVHCTSYLNIHKNKPALLSQQLHYQLTLSDWIGQFNNLNYEHLLFFFATTTIIFLAF